MSFRGKKISVLGDSISTLKGYTETAGCFYGKKLCAQAGIRDVHDVWWMRVIEGFGGELENVSAFMGSCVSEGFGLGRCGIERADELGQPELVLVHMGVNDAFFGVPEALFEKEYRRLLARLKELHPGAKVICSTPMRGRKVLEEVPLFSDKTDLPLARWAEIIRAAAAEAGAVVADLWASGEVYDAVDGSHPTAGGMEAIARLFLAAAGRGE